MPRSSRVPWLGGDVFDRVDNPLMSSAAAKIAVHMFDDLVARRSRIVAQQHVGIQQHSRGAIAALERAVVDECLLQRVQVAVPGKSLDGKQFGACLLYTSDAADEE